MTADQLNEINRMIQQDLATSRQLLAILEQETDATKSRDYNTLAKCLDDKVPLLEQLQQNSQRRSEWLQAMGKQANEAGWLSFLQATDRSELQKQWHEVKKTVEHCQKMNSVNGKLISRGVASHSRLLHILRGNSSPSDLYDAKGSKHSTALSGHLVQA